MLPITSGALGPDAGCFIRSEGSVSEQAGSTGKEAAQRPSTHAPPPALRRQSCPVTHVVGSVQRPCTHLLPGPKVPAHCVSPLQSAMEMLLSAHPWAAAPSRRGVNTARAKKV